MPRNESETLQDIEESNPRLRARVELKRFEAFLRARKNPCLLRDGIPCAHYVAPGSRNSQGIVQGLICDCGAKAGSCAEVPLTDAIECLEEKRALADG